MLARPFVQLIEILEPAAAELASEMPAQTGVQDEPGLPHLHGHPKWCQIEATTTPCSLLLLFSFGLFPIERAEVGGLRQTEAGVEGRNAQRYQQRAKSFDPTGNHRQTGFLERLKHPHERDELLNAVLYRMKSERLHVDTIHGKIHQRRDELVWVLSDS